VSPPHKLRMSALAYLYDHIRDLPQWFRQLPPGQLEDIAAVMAKWSFPADDHSVVPLEETERREVLRAIVISGGNVIRAARALGISKATIYYKLKQWGYAIQNRKVNTRTSLVTGDLRYAGKQFSHNVTLARRQADLGRFAQ
jgi:hypothetical protein